MVIFDHFGAKNFLVNICQLFTQDGKYFRPTKSKIIQIHQTSLVQRTDPVQILVCCLFTCLIFYVCRVFLRVLTVCK